MSRNQIVALGALVMASSLSAAADTANVNTYGTFNLSFESVNADGANDPSKSTVNRLRLASNSSNFGVKGTEELGEGIKAIFQAELGLNLGTGQLGGELRNSGVGLSYENGGTLLFGKWDTPFKIANVFMEPFYGTGVGYLAGILDSPGNSTASTDSRAIGDDQPLAFSRRQGNLIQYWSPNMSGVTVKAAYSTNANRGTYNPDLLSGSLGYEAGPLTAAFAYEQHDDAVAGGKSSVFGNSLFSTAGAITPISTKDTGFKAALGYKLFDTTSLNVGFTSLKYTAKTGEGEYDYNRPAYAVTAIHKIDALAFRLGLAMAKEGSGSTPTGELAVAGLGAKFATLGASYSMSRRTDVYLIGSKIWNESGTYNFGLSSISGISAGADPAAVGLGFRHVF